MANPGFVVPIGVQGKEGFHALRRTTEGLLYYTKVNKDSGETLDFEGGSPTDPRGNRQISNLSELGLASGAHRPSTRVRTAESEPWPLEI